MDARTSRRGKRISKQQEERTAAALGGRTQAASGATRLGGGGDVRVQGKVRVECKVTEAQHYTLKKTDLEKLRNQAAKNLEEPVFQFAFRDKLGKLEAYAVVLGFVQEDTEPSPHLFSTMYNSTTLTQLFLKSAFYGPRARRVRITFQDGSKWHKHWEVMPWEEYLRRKDAL
jgi:hypothetical protein